jgi:3'-phosphoadenosine 5'-phosphosulfate sulfotransferase (PAPS reductase)/FAD synthetase
MVAVRKDWPLFVEIDGAVHDIWAQYGLPADLLPSRHDTTFGRMITDPSPHGIRLQPRYDCCSRTLWAPMMKALNNHPQCTLIISGTKQHDALHPHDFLDITTDTQGREWVYPLASWTHDDVFGFLRQSGVAIPRVYDYGLDGHDCLTCPAYLVDAPKRAFIEAVEPHRLPLYEQHLQLVALEQAPDVVALHKELGNE